MKYFVVAPAVDVLPQIAARGDLCLALYSNEAAGFTHKEGLRPDVRYESLAKFKSGSSTSRERQWGY